MTKDEALKLALEALDDIEHQRFSWRRFDALVAIKQALAQPEQEPVAWRRQHEGDVSDLCQWLYADEYEPKDDNPNWKPLYTTPPLPVQERNFCPRCGKRTADLTTIHTCTPPVAAASQAFYGFPHGPVSTPNAGGKCVTAGETAPPKEIDPNQWAFDNGLEST